MKPSLLYTSRRKPKKKVIVAAMRKLFCDLCVLKAEPYRSTCQTVLDTVSVEGLSR